MLPARVMFQGSLYLNRRNAAGRGWGRECRARIRAIRGDHGVRCFCSEASERLEIQNVLVVYT